MYICTEINFVKLSIFVNSPICVKTDGADMKYTLLFETVAFHTKCR